MPQIPVHKVGSLGIIRDTVAVDLPAQAWSSGQNVRFEDGAAMAFPGHEQVFGVPAVAPHNLMQVSVPAGRWWMYMGVNKVYAVQAGTHSNITRQTAGEDVDYTKSEDTPWTGGVFSGIPVLNNGIDVPQYWSPVSVAQRLQDLPGWDPTHRARVIRPFKQFLVALDITKGPERFPYMVKWSDAAEPGALPATWTPSATNQAEERDLAEARGKADYLVDCLPLGDVNIIYREHSVYAMQYVGPPFVFSTRRLPFEFGILAPRCVAMFQGRHIVLARDDVLIHDGTRAQSILTNRQKKWLFEQINPDKVHNCFVVANATKTEIWICFPEVDKIYASRALVWNWEDNTFGDRVLPEISDITTGQGDVEASVTIDEDVGTFDSDNAPFDERPFTPAISHLIGSEPLTSKIVQFGVGFSADGVAMPVRLERTEIPLQPGSTASPDSVKFVRGVWLHIDAVPYESMKIYVGSQMAKGGSVTWQGPFTLNPANQRKIDCLISTVYPALRIESEDANATWKLFGYEFDLDIGGRF